MGELKMKCNTLEDANTYLGKNYKTWMGISRVPNLTDEFIIANIDNLNLSTLITVQNISESLIEQHKKSLTVSGWDGVSSRPTLSLQFVENNIDNVNWWSVWRYNTNLTEEFISKHFDRIHWNHQRIFSTQFTQCLTEDFFIKYEDYITDDFLTINFDRVSYDILEQFSNRVDWGRVSQNHRLTEPIMYRFRDYLCWEIIESNRKVSKSGVIERNGDKVELSKINTKDDTINIDFLINLVTELDTRVKELETKLSKPLL